MTTCGICGGGARAGLRGKGFAERRCTACGHREAEHAAPEIVADYHLQYDQTGFVAALEQTRRRQARIIVAALRRCAPDARRVLDFGCGRGWFLDEARDAGWAEVAGADASAHAVDLLAARGIPGVHLRPPVGDAGWVDTLPFRPDALAVLDVLEHFPPAVARRLLRATLTALAPELRAIVVKVPVPGALFHAARLLQRAGIDGPLAQLYQVGTSPPHVSYFSRDSIARLVRDCGLEVVEELGDLDFEPESIGARAVPLAGIPRPVSRALGSLAARICDNARLYDSIIVIARPSSAQPPSASR